MLVRYSFCCSLLSCLSTTAWYTTLVYQAGVEKRDNNGQQSHIEQTEGSSFSNEAN